MRKVTPIKPAPRNTDPLRHKNAEYLSAFFLAQDAVSNVRGYCPPRLMNELPSLMSDVLARHGIGVSATDIKRLSNPHAENRHVDLFPETLVQIADILTLHRSDLFPSSKARKAFIAADRKKAETYVANRQEDQEYLKELGRLENLFDLYVGSRTQQKRNILYESGGAYHADVKRAGIDVPYHYLARVRNCTQRKIFPNISIADLRACSEMIERKAFSLQMAAGQEMAMAVK